MEQSGSKPRIALVISDPVGFDRGVMPLGGFLFPICTPAHDSTYGIARQGIANPDASYAGVRLAARMARS